MTVTEKEQEQPPKTKYARLTPKQWAEAETLWETGEITVEGLCARFGKNPRSFYEHFKKHNIVRGSKSTKHKDKVADQVAKTAMSEATVLAARIRETKEEHYQMAAGLAKLTWTEIVNARTKQMPIASALNNIKALESAMNVLKRAREERYAVLGLDRDDYTDEDDVPTLLIEELTREQEEALRHRSFAPAEALDDDDELDLDLDGVDDLQEVD